MSKKIADSVIISALLRCGTQEEAAKSIGISPQTIVNRMKKPDFMKQYHEAQNELLRGTTRRLANANAQSIDLLIDVLNDPEQNVRVRVGVANDILRLSRDFTMLDEIQRRLTVLENRENEPQEQMIQSYSYKPIADTD